MAKKPTKGKKTGTTVTLLRTRPISVQAEDVTQSATLGLVIGQGGASHLYDFEPALKPRRVAKIYKDAYRADKEINAAQKLVGLVTRHQELSAKLPFVLWPDELVLDRPSVTAATLDDAVLGFTMLPLPDNTVSLFTLLKQTRYRRHFERDATIRLAAQLAEHIARLHRESLVLCDLNPKNIHVSKNLEVLTFIDADGYQISVNGKNLPSRGVTEGYASPAAIANFKSNPLAVRTPAEDDFVLAILIFQLLLDRAHPFATGPLYAEHPSASHNDNIVARRFAFSDPARFHPDEHALSQYRRLVTPLKAAFHRSFLTPTPLTAFEWARLLPAYFMKHLAAAPTPEPTANDIRAIGQPVAPKPAPASAGQKAASTRCHTSQRAPSRPIPPIGGAAKPPLAGSNPDPLADVPSIPIARNSALAVATIIVIGMPLGFFAGQQLFEQSGGFPPTHNSRAVSQMLTELPETLEAVHATLRARNSR